jgi:hypothetical protein
VGSGFEPEPGDQPGGLALALGVIAVKPRDLLADPRRDKPD